MANDPRDRLDVVRFEVFAISLSAGLAAAICALREEAAA